MPIAAVIFDVDGVLVDSPHEQAWRETFDELMRGKWADVRPKTTYSPEKFDTHLYQKLVSGKPRNAGALAILEYFHVPDASARVPTYAQEKQDKLVSFINAGQFQVFPDAIRFVSDCLRQRRVIAAASSSKNATQILSSIPVQSPVDIAHVRWLDLFTVNVSGRPVPHGKPYPDIFLAAANDLHVRPDECVVVEDAVSGIRAANAGNMRSIGVARLDDDTELQNAGADLVVHSLDEVSREAMANGNLELAVAPELPTK